jgi:hypothetical protein
VDNSNENTAVQATDGPGADLAPKGVSRRQLIKGSVAVAGGVVAAGYIKPDLRSYGVAYAQTQEQGSPTGQNDCEDCQTLSQGYFANHETQVANLLAANATFDPSVRYDPNDGVTPQLFVGGYWYTAAQVDQLFALNGSSGDTGGDQSGPIGDGSGADTSVQLVAQLLAAKLSLLQFHQDAAYSAPLTLPAVPSTPPGLPTQPPVSTTPSLEAVIDVADAALNFASHNYTSPTNPADNPLIPVSNPPAGDGYNVDDSPYKNYFTTLQVWLQAFIDAFDS